jgi:hypothetical protein
VLQRLRYGERIASGHIIGRIFQRLSGRVGNNTVASRTGKSLVGRNLKNLVGCSCLYRGVSVERTFRDDAIADKERPVVSEHFPDVLPGFIERGKGLIAVDRILSGIISGQGQR